MESFKIFILLVFIYKFLARKGQWRSLVRPPAFRSEADPSPVFCKALPPQRQRHPAAVEEHASLGSTVVIHIDITSEIKIYFMEEIVRV